MGNYENKLENGNSQPTLDTKNTTKKNIFQTLNEKEKDFMILEYLRKNPHHTNIAGLASKKPLPEYANFGELLSFAELNEKKFWYLLQTDKKLLAKKLLSEKKNWLNLLEKGSEFEKENGLEKHLTYLLELLKN